MRISQDALNNSCISQETCNKIKLIKFVLCFLHFRHFDFEWYFNINIYGALMDGQSKYCVAAMMLSHSHWSWIHVCYIVLVPHWLSGKRWLRHSGRFKLNILHQNLTKVLSWTTKGERPSSVYATCFFNKPGTRGQDSNGLLKHYAGRSANESVS